MKAAQINKANGTTGITTGTTTPADSSGRMLTNDGAFADLESENPNIVMPGLQGAESILKALGIGGGGSPAPVTRSSTAPVQPTNTLALDVFKGLEGQDIRSWSPLQIESYIKQVVAETNGAITAKQALAIFQTAAKKGD